MCPNDISRHLLQCIRLKHNISTPHIDLQYFTSTSPMDLEHCTPTIWQRPITTTTSNTYAKQIRNKANQQNKAYNTTTPKQRKKRKPVLQQSLQEWGGGGLRSRLAIPTSPTYCRKKNTDGFDETFTQKFPSRLSGITTPQRLSEYTRLPPSNTQD